MTPDVALDWQGWLTLFTCVGVLLTLALTRLTPDLVLLAALALLSVTGILTAEQALGGFANPGLITVAALFIVAAGVQNSGGVDAIVGRVLGRPKSYRGALARLMLPVSAMSGFLNNTPVVATMIPAVSRWSKQIDIVPSRLMIPLSYASIFGGTLTLIGTSTNLVVNGQFQALTGRDGFGMFDITPVGLGVALAGLSIMLLTAKWLLPERRSVSEQFANRREFTFEVAVAENGPLVGLSIQDAGLRHLGRIFLAEIERQGAIVTAVAPEERLQAGDRLVFVGETDAIVDVLRINGLVASDSSTPVIEKDMAERRLVEAVVSPLCDGIGQTLRDGRFRDRYGAVVLAVNRNGESIRGNLGSITLEAGDVLLLEARSPFITRQRQLRDFLMINDLNEQRPDHSKTGMAIGILATMVLLATFGITTMLNAALLAAFAMVATRCLTMAEARRSLDLTVIITIAASFALGNALQVSGAAAWIGSGVLVLADGNPLLLLVLTFFAVSLLTEMITNNAAALIMLPVVLSMTSVLGLNPEPYVIAVMIAASASYATPLGYQTNLMVFGPGGYRFTDFMRIGIMMNIVAGIVTILLVPMIWPLV